MDNRKEVVPLYYIGLTEEEIKVLMKFIAGWVLPKEDMEIIDSIYVQVDEDFPHIMKD